MNVFINEKESGNYYNFFDVSTINISLRELSKGKYAIDIHAFNDTFHVYAYILTTKDYEGEEYRDLEHSIKTENFISIACDVLHAMPRQI